MQQYRPVRLELISPILEGSDNNLLECREYVITIRCPILYTFDKQQTLPTIIKKRVRVGQTLLLKLLPSDLTLPRGRYEVIYAYADKPNEILSTEEWVVPSIRDPFRTALDLESAILIYDLPADFFIIDKIKTVGTLPAYKVLNNTIVFASAPQAQKIWVEYYKVLTRADVLYNPKTWKKLQPEQTGFYYDDSIIY